MKKHTTMKYFNNFEKVFRAGYCDLQDIYKYSEPQFYNSGVYGWNCDIYVDYARDIAITTGYRNMKGQLIPNELIKKYSEIAKDIYTNAFNNMTNYTDSYNKMIEALDKNIENFLNELCKL